MTRIRENSSSSKNNPGSDDQKLRQYFTAINTNSEMNLKAANYYSEERIFNVDWLIERGQLVISNTKQSADDLLEKQKISQYQVQELEMKAKRQNIERQLQYLSTQIGVSNASNQQQKSFNKQMVLSKEQHQQVVSEIMKKRQQRNQQHQLLQNKRIQKQEQERIKSKEIQQEKIINAQKIKKEEIELKLKKQKEIHEEFIRNQIQSKEKLQILKNKKSLYQKIQERYEKQILIPNLQERKKMLKEKRQFTTLNIEQLKQHEELYMEKKKYQQSRRSTLKTAWNYIPPPKSEKLTSILEEEKMEKITKMQEKKRQIQERTSRQEVFISQLKEHFKPMIDPAKKEEIQNRLMKNSILTLQPKDIRSIGMSYLEEAKRKRRKSLKIDHNQVNNGQLDNERADTQRNLSLMSGDKQQKSRTITNYLNEFRSKKDENFEKKRRNNLQQLANCEDLTQHERIRKLKMETDKINENLRMQEKLLKYKKNEKMEDAALELLLSSIHAKMGIVNMFK